MTKLSLILLSFMSICLACADNKITGLQIDNAWIQEGPPTARVLAGFMTIKNIGQENIILQAANSPAFKKIEFHRTVHENGMARMLKQTELTLKAGEQTELKQGGYHLMLIQPQKALTAGDKIKVSFQTTTGPVDIEFLVRRADENSSQHHHHHH